MLYVCTYIVHIISNSNSNRITVLNPLNPPDPPQIKLNCEQREDIKGLFNL